MTHRNTGLTWSALLVTPWLALPLATGCGSGTAQSAGDQNGGAAGATVSVVAGQSGSAPPATSSAGSTGAALAGHSALGVAGASVASAGSSAAAAGTSAVAGSVATNAGVGGSANGETTGAAGASGGSAGGATGGSAGAGGAVATSTNLTWGGLDPTMREDPGKGDGSDVITIGDSWMNLGATGIEQSLDGAGTKYRHYAVAGTLLENGQIPGQYTQAKGANPKIATVIMTGGGNDIMFSGGCDTADACLKSVMAINDALDKLWTTMAADGVKDVIYIQYSEDAGTTPKDTRPKNVDPPPICTTGKIYCHYLPTTDIVMKQLMADGIHPTKEACDRIAAALVQMMTERKMRR
jgi:hypothetical protein